MKKMTFISLAVVLVALLVIGAASAAAQIDIPDKEGPDMPGPRTPAEEIICDACCKHWSAPSKPCQKMCGCGGPDGGPCSSGVMSETYAKSDESRLEQSLTLATLWQTLRERYPKHAKVYETFNERILSLYLRNPSVGRRSAQFIAKVAPGIAAAALGDAKTEATHTFDAGHLKLLRGVLKDLSRLDRKSFDGELAAAIEDMVLASLDKSLLGKTQMAALECILATKCAD